MRMGQGVRTGLGHGGITCVLQAQFSSYRWFLRYCHFRVYAIFSNSPWQSSWIVNLHKYEIVLFRDLCDQI